MASYHAISNTKDIPFLPPTMKLYSILPCLLSAAAMAAPPLQPSSDLAQSDIHARHAGGASYLLSSKKLTARNSGCCNDDCHSPTAKGYIHFFDQTNPNITLYIQTLWNAFYTTQLRRELKAEGFTLTTPDNKSECGWIYIRCVESKEVWRGSIGYRLSTNVEDQSLEPGRETIEHLRKILLNTFPVLEIVMITGFILVLLPVSICACCLYGCYSCKKKEAKENEQQTKKMDATKSNVLPLQTAKARTEVQTPPPAYK